MTQYQDYTLTIRRAPTLKELRVTEENGLCRCAGEV